MLVPARRPRRADHRAALLGLLLSLAQGSACADQQTLQLDVAVNGRSIGKLGEFVLRDDVLLARRQELIDLGFRPSSESTKPDDLIPLSSLHGVTVRLDRAAQAVNIAAPDSALLPTMIAAGSGAARTGADVQSATGALLNYDMSTTRTGGHAVAAGAFDARVFSAWGTAGTTGLAYLGQGPIRSGERNAATAIRLDSAYTYADPETMRQYLVGDMVTGGLAWTRPIRMGGVQISANFSLRPDLVTFPLPTVGGSVAVPSTVDVLVNGSKVASQSVEAGPFELTKLPIVTGAGTVAVTVTDALGRQETLNLPFYGSADLLAPDLQTYSVELGAVRRNWGVLSNDYGEPAAIVTYRRGLTERLTIEGHAEGTRSIAVAGGGVVFNLADLARANVSAAGSVGTGAQDPPDSTRNRPGFLVSGGVQRVGRVLSFGASATVADPSYRDVAALNADPVPRLQLNANMGLSLGQYGAIGINYAALNPGRTAKHTASFVPNDGPLYGPSLSANNANSFERVRLLSASYSTEIGNVALYATGYRDFAQRGSAGLIFGITLPLGGSGSVGATTSVGAGGMSSQAQAQKTAVGINDWGYQAVFDHAQENRGYAQGQYRSPWGLMTAGVDRSGNQTAFRGEAEGAIVLLDGGLFASNRIEDSFAVVDTGDVGNVGVTQENRPIGHTNAAGQLLVPNLRSFDVNRVAIEPTDVALDTTVTTTVREVRPQFHSGIVVDFPIRVSHGALLVLVDDAGIPLPLGTAATLDGAAAAVPVGFDGQAYVEGLHSHNVLSVERPDGSRCAAAFEYRPSPGDIPRIGPITCHAARP